MRILKWLAALMFAAVLGGQAAQAGPAKPALWEVTGGQGKLYLFGTVHLLPAGIDWMDSVLPRLKASDRLVLELAADDLADRKRLAVALLSAGRLPEGQSLQKLLPPDVYAEVIKRAQPAGLPPQAVDRMRPWLVSTLLAVQAAQLAGFDAELGVDKMLLRYAQDTGKPVHGLETAETQIAAFAGQTDQAGVEMVTDTLAELDDAKAYFAKLAKVWASGDARGTEKLGVKRLRRLPALYKSLLLDRHAAWTPKLEAYLAAPETSFVAVGAGHMVGPDGLVKLLQARGYKVRRVQ